MGSILNIHGAACNGYDILQNTHPPGIHLSSIFILQTRLRFGSRDNQSDWINRHTSQVVVGVKYWVGY